MGRIAVVFPGQGSQYVGMGRELGSLFEEANRIFQEAGEVLGYDLAQLIFEGPKEKLDLTVHTQPALVTTSVAFWKVLKSYGVEPDFFGGHSVGEYSALAAAGVLDWRDALRAVSHRARFMEEAVPHGEGGMMAILGLSEDKVEEICRKIRENNGIVEVANINCPGQVVIGGYNRGLEEAAALAKQYGARKVVRLDVSGPFHTSLMRPAADKLRAVLDGMTFAPARKPVVANVDAGFPASGEEFKKALLRQIVSPVQWEKCVRRLGDEGVSTFIEVGPGRTLTGLIRRILPEARMVRVEDGETLENALASLKAGD